MKKVKGRTQNENAPRRVLSSFFILLVRLYKLTLSPLITFLAGPAGACRFEPSCSQYAIEALKTHGALSGGWLATKRICRCHPWSGKCGEDPVPQKSKPNPTLDSVSHPQISVGVTNFLPLPKGEGRGEGEGDMLNANLLKADTGKSLRFSYPAFRAPRLSSVALAKEDRI